MRPFDDWEYAHGEMIDFTIERASSYILRYREGDNAFSPSIFASFMRWLLMLERQRYNAEISR